jgi:hypothetical protein
MLQHLLIFAKNLRLSIALRIRPMAFAGRLISKTLAKAGPRFAQLYHRTSERLVNSELKWINQWGINDDDFYDLLTLYPNLKRVLFIHIPKCGGTSIREVLVDDFQCAPIPLPGSGTINQSIDYMTASVFKRMQPGQLPQGDEIKNDGDTLRQRYLRVFTGYCFASNPGHLFILGHKRARELNPLYRPRSDFFFTTVRAPVAILKSMVTYRVSHTLKNRHRQDSIELLEAMQLDYQDFSELVTTNPKELTARILEIKPPSLVSYLAMDHRTDAEAVWQGIKEQSVFIAHMSEQDRMLAKLFGKQPQMTRKNTSEGREGLAGEFSAALQDSWLESSVEPDSALLYQRLESTGIIGFWGNGGTVAEYQELLQNA